MPKTVNSIHFNCGRLVLDYLKENTILRMILPRQQFRSAYLENIINLLVMIGDDSSKAKTAAVNILAVETQLAKIAPQTGRPERPLCQLQ
jgi:hypothetical protein